MSIIKVFNFTTAKLGSKNDLIHKLGKKKQWQKLIFKMKVFNFNMGKFHTKKWPEQQLCGKLTVYKVDLQKNGLKLHSGLNLDLDRAL